MEIKEKYSTIGSGFKKRKCFKWYFDEVGKGPLSRLNLRFSGKNNNNIIYVFYSGCERRRSMTVKVASYTENTYINMVTYIYFLK